VVGMVEGPDPCVDTWVDICVGPGDCSENDRESRGDRVRAGVDVENVGRWWVDGDGPRLESGIESSSSDDL
jgi:hypothetical protein